MKQFINQLSKTQIAVLKEGREVLSILNDCDLVYEEQVPNSVIALIDGEIELIKKSKTFDRLSPGCLYGIHHLIHQEPVKIGCKVMKNSKIILIGKSEILEGLKNSKSQLFQLLKEFRKNEKTK